MRLFFATLSVAPIFALAGPATLPQPNPAATQQAFEFRKVVMDLRAEVAALKKENAELRARIKQMEDAALPKTVSIGMTAVEAAAVYKRMGWEREEESRDEMIRGKSVTFMTWKSPPRAAEVGDSFKGVTLPNQNFETKSPHELKVAAAGQPRSVYFRDGVVVQIDR